MDFPNFMLVLIDWVDSQAGEGWVALDDLKGAPLVTAQSAGWIVDETPEAITIAGHLGKFPMQCSGEMTIPKVAISNIMPLRLDLDPEKMWRKVRPRSMSMEEFDALSEDKKVEVIRKAEELIYL